MKITYQPEVIQKSNEIIADLEKNDFFGDFEIQDKQIASQILCEELTKKFIEGSLNEEDLFSADEWKKIVQDIILLDTMNGLKEKGLIESYDDENTHEVFFLTNKGKELTKIMNKTKTGQ